MKRELTMLWVHAERIGYGRMGEKIAEALRDQGVTVYDDDGRPAEYRKSEAADLGHQAVPPAPTNVMSLMSVPTHLDGHYKDQYLSILTMWESRILPPAFRESMHVYDMIMVPSEQNVELFSQYHDNVQFITLGVDPALWHPIPVTPPARTFDFLIAGRGSRKGVDLAYKAFRTVFPNPEQHDPMPRLVMKSMRGHDNFYSPTVTHVTGVLSPEAERDLYASAHCYVQPSRGEGFGLQPLQAMALGRPTILTDAHGHKSFSDLGIGIPAASSKADYFIYGDAGEWWEPDFDALCEAMWDVYQNYAHHVALASLSATVIQRTRTWDHVADRFVDLHEGLLSVPYSGDGTWIQPEKKKYPCRVEREWNGEIAGHAVRMQPGITYWQDADILRILFDAQVLDATCLDEAEDGLLPEQVAEMGLYQAEHSWCPTCHQQLNSGIQRSDVIFAELEAEAAERA